MRPLLKVAIVAGGYLLALLMASLSVALHVALASETGAEGSGGMSAFGDLVLFVVVFGVVAAVPTAAGLFFLFTRRKKSGQSPGPEHSSTTPPAGQGVRPR